MNNFFWPLIPAGVRKVSREYHVCAQELVRLRSHQSLLKLFLASRLLESVATDILSPFSRSIPIHKYLLVITDRFIKMAHTVALTNVTTLTKVPTFVSHWFFPYGHPKVLLSDNGSQLVSRLFQFKC